MKTLIVLMLSFAVTVCSFAAEREEWIPDSAYGNGCVTKYTLDGGVWTRSTEKYIRDATGNYVQCDLELLSADMFRLSEHSVAAAGAYMAARITEFTVDECERISPLEKIYFDNTKVYSYKALYITPTGEHRFIMSPEMWWDYKNTPVRVLGLIPVEGGEMPIFADDTLPPKLRVGDSFFRHNGTSWELDQ